MQVQTASVSTAVASLERALSAGGTHRPRDWAQRVERALSAVVQEIRQQDAHLESADGGVVDVGNGRVPAAGLDRHAGHLREDLICLLADAHELRDQLRTVLAGEPPGDLGDIPLRAAALLEALEGHLRDEANLMLESATTDIGAGD